MRPSRHSVSTAVLSVLLALSTRHEAKAATGPCDIYQAAGNPCVAAHSTVRALYGSYSGKLYQVRRSDNTTKDIMALSAGGAADAAAQDSFCTGSTCVITKIYDQSGKGNDLQYQGSGSTPGGHDYPSTATKESLYLSGHKVYSLWIDGTETTSAPGSTTNQPNSYWVNGSGNGVPLGASPQGIYMVTSGTHVNNGCCFDYGNSETSRTAVGAGHMDAIYFGTSCWFSSNSGYKCSASGSGPWVQADIEYGLFASNSQTSWNSKEVSFSNKYVTAMEKNNGTTQFVLKGGNAQSGSLTSLYSGSLPAGWNPMHKEGAIVLGSGGDCCNTNQNMSAGTFYEGAIVAGSSIPTDATDNAIQANIVAAGYGVTTAILPTADPGSTAKFRYDATNARAIVDFNARDNGNADLEVVDLRGRRMASIVDRVFAGPHEIAWNAGQAPSGIYIGELSINGKPAWTGKFVRGE